MSALDYLGGPLVASGHKTRPMSPAVRDDDFLHVAGLALTGIALTDVCKTTGWLDDARDFGSFKRIHMSCFPVGKLACASTEARLMADAKVQINVVACKPEV